VNLRQTMLLSSALLFGILNAVAPPKIELELSLSQSQANGQQDYTQRCPASASLTQADCPFPKPKATDTSTTEELNVTTTLFLVDRDGSPGPNCDNDCNATQVDFSMRSTYLFNYNAVDSAGNEAEEVIFVLYLDDLTIPEIHRCGAAVEAVEAASNWQMCAFTATDNFDDASTITANLRYDVYHKDKNDQVNKVCDMCTHDATKNAISALKLGQYEVYPYVHDNAGPYGQNGRDNVNGGNDPAFRKSIMVDDTLPPYIELLGYNPAYLQCGHEYIDDGWKVHDLYDTHAMGNNIDSLSQSNEDDLGAGENKGKSLGDKVVTYEAQDHAGNVAEVKTRTVKVVDTLPPTVFLTGHPNEVQWAVGSDFLLEEHDTATCMDECAVPSLTKTWNRPFNDSKIGTYYRTYTCTDDVSLTASILRTFTVYDAESPELELIGNSTSTFQACNPSLNKAFCASENGWSDNQNGEYLDPGATCNDVVDGPLSHSVEVSGNIVNVRVPGTYVINYDCQDLSGNPATRIHRTVIIEDTECPTISLNGLEIITIEAGSEYHDEGATANDELDGVLTEHIVKEGDTIDSYMAFEQYHYECGRIQQCAAADNKTLNSGPYRITPQQNHIKTDSDNYMHNFMDVYCDFADSSGGEGHQHAMTTNRTYVPCLGCAEVEVEDADDLGDCKQLGLQWKRAYNTDLIAPVLTAIETGVSPFPSDPTSSESRDLRGLDGGLKTNRYLCYHEPLEADNEDAALNTNTSSLRPLLDRCFPETWGSSRTPTWLAAPGDFRVTYTVTDSHGNTQCPGTNIREVKVVDTMPPVITLHLKHRDLDDPNIAEVIHTSGNPSTDKSKIDETLANPARSSDNPYLENADDHYSEVANSFKTNSLHNAMFLAEQPVSFNSWIVAAVGVAASGFAFIVYSRRTAASVIDV